MKTQYTIAVIAALAALAALCMTASAGDYGSGCPYSNFYNGTLEDGGGIYFDVKGHYDNPGATQSYTFENVPDGRQVVRMYPGIWLGSPYPGRVTEWSIEINEHTDYFNFTEPGSLPFCDLDCPPEDGTGEHCTVSCSGCGVCSVTYNAGPYVVTGDNDVTYWTDEQIYQVGLLAVYENESMEELQYWVKEGHEYPDDEPYHVYFSETGNTGPIDTGNISAVEYYTYGYPHCPGESEWPELNGNYIGSPNITKTNGYAPVFYGWTEIPPAYIDAPDNCFLYPTIGNDRMMVPVLGIHYSEVTYTYTISGYTTPAADNVNITNLNNSKEWEASMDGDYYSLTLTPGVDVNATEILRIIACDEIGNNESNCNVTDHTVTEEEINAGGVSNVNLTLNHYCLNYYPGYPYYTQEEDNWSGPAVMKACIAHYYDPGDVPSQAELNETGIANNTACNADLQYVDPEGMWTTLNHNWMWSIGRNYGLYSRPNTTDGLNDMLHYTCFWQHLGPAPVPAYGDYANWMVVRGIHTSENPYPQSAGSYDIYGFWLNDPNPDGIGENTYKTVDQWTDEYYLELTGVRDCDDYRYKYVGLFEPPEQPAREVRAVPARPRFADAITPAMAEKMLVVYDAEQLALEKVVKDDEMLKIVAAAIDGVTEELIPYDAEFAEVFAETVPGSPMLATDDGDDYYLVPFNVPVEVKQIKKVPVEIEKVKISGLRKLERLKRVDADVIIKPIPIEPIKVERTLVVVLVDAEDGSFKEASWVADPVKYLPVSKAEALKLALGEISITAKEDLSSLTSKPTIELVHRDASPYYPDWKITVNDQVFYVSQDGTVSS